MEKKMREYILGELMEYNDCVAQLDEEALTNDVLKSFKDAKTYKHYILIVPSDIDEYYTNDEHFSFKKKGYYQLADENRYSNRFFVPISNVDNVCDILAKEGMKVEQVKSPNLPTTVYVVTLYGKNESYFDNDYPKNDNSSVL